MRRHAEHKVALRRPTRIPVPTGLASPHPLIEMTSRSLARAKPDATGLVQPTNKQCIPIKVSPASVDRAMLIMDTLIKAAEAKGWAVRVNPRHWIGLHVKVGEEEVSVFMEELVESRAHVPTEEEKRKQKEEPWFFAIPKRERVASGRLHVGVHGAWSWGRGHWSDTTRWRVEECLDLCMEAIAKTAEGQPRVREQQRLDHLKWKEAERQQLDAERLHEEQAARQVQVQLEEERRIRALTEIIERMRMADIMLLYADRMENAARAAHADLGEASSLGRWLTWVRQYAKKTDPCNLSAAIPHADGAT
jgi:hypothetical protein